MQRGAEADDGDRRLLSHCTSSSQRGKEQCLNKYICVYVGVYIYIYIFVYCLIIIYQCHQPSALNLLCLPKCLTAFQQSASLCFGLGSLLVAMHPSHPLPCTLPSHASLTLYASHQAQAACPVERSPAKHLLSFAPDSYTIQLPVDACLQLACSVSWSTSKEQCK